MIRTPSMFGLQRLLSRITGAGTLILGGAITADRTKTLQNTTATLAELETAQTFTVEQTIDKGTGALPAATNATRQILALANVDSQGTNIEVFGFNAAPLIIRTRAAGGTRAVPTGVVGDTDVLPSLSSSTYDGTAWQTNTANTRCQADGTHSGANRGTYYTWAGTPNGSTAAATWMWLQGGNLGVGVAPTVSNGLVQLTSGTTAASGFACGTDTHWYRDSAGSWSADSNIKIATVGKGLYVKEGTNATMGAGTLAAGSVVISTTKVTATSRVFLTSQADGGTVGFLRVSTRTAATSFTITSSSAADTSTVAWIILEPA